MADGPVTTTRCLDAVDAGHLRQALDLAARTPRRPWPNPPVGAVVVGGGEVLGVGAHHGAGTAHAERVALEAAGARARGATLYCTLEPCHHHGRTPPCTGAILAAGIARVVVGMRDPNPVAAGGLEALQTAGIAVQVADATLGAACLDLVWPFVASGAFARPYVELKTAVSLDARFAGPDDPAGRPVYLTGEAARRRVHTRRRWADLVLVGAGTARQDRPRLDTRLVAADAPLPAAAPQAGVVAGRGTAPRLARDRWLLFAPATAAGGAPAAAGAAGAEVVPCPAGAAGPEPAAVLAACQARGLHTVLLESGPRLALAFLAAGLVDRWCAWTAPRVLGGGPTWPDGAAAAPPAFHLTRTEAVGADLLAVYDRTDFATILATVTTPPGAAGGGARCSPA